MTRMQFAGLALLAAAFIQGALLLNALQNRIPTADAELLMSRETIQMMTTQTRGTEESLFVLDQSSGRLLVYNCDLGQRRIDLSGAAQLGTFFGQNDTEIGRAHV